MTDAIAVAKEIRCLLEVISRQEPALPTNPCFRRDLDFLNQCVAAVSSHDPDAINDVWVNVQNMGRFFGQYASAPHQSRLFSLLSDFQDAMLDEVIKARSKSKS
jgi:hypothetical protein